jgi:hypothetical protein
LTGGTRAAIRARRVDGEPMMTFAIVTMPPIEHSGPRFQFKLMQSS